ncbi:MAG: GNAT family N-acetyltransferase [Flavobacteriales bacterium]|nr:GNAT family N-acetyltransferase [Flavobacteriales bacterium]
MPIRIATLADIPTIRAIAHETWPAAYFPKILGAEQLAYMLELLYSEIVLEDVMTKKGQQFVLFIDRGTALGFAGFTPHHRGTATTHLNKLYVLPEAQGTGAGKLLLEHVLTEASNRGDTSVELNVNKRNEAVAFYTYMGFRILRDEVIDIGQGYVMDDHVMVKQF